MKVVDASPWEKRNLGMSAWEITLDRADMADVPGTIAALKDSKFDNSYVCIKLPVGDLQMVHALEDDGFRFLEVQMALVDHFNPDELSRQLQSLHLELTPVEVPREKEKWADIISRISPGMFETDRIALDPRFGSKVSCARYKNWCMDLLENNNSHLMVYKSGDDVVAFNLSVYDEGRKSNEGIIGGVFEEFKDSGFGVSVVNDDKGRDAFGKRKTHVSSNNLPVVKLHQRCGRIMTDMVYVFRKIIPA